MTKKNYRTYEGYKFDSYIGQRLYTASNCCGKNQFRIEEHLLFRNEEGLLGSVGLGVTWGLNYLTKSGSYCFNPLSEEEIVWSPAHNAYVYKHQQGHFLYPIIVGQFYYFKDGVKTFGFMNNKIEKLDIQYRHFQNKKS